MVNSPDHLFVYGTLRPSFKNIFAQYLRQHSQYRGEGYFAGLLLDLGAYPGAVYQAGSHTRVWGNIYEISANKEQLLHYLDDYEGITGDIDHPDEYVRSVVSVQQNDHIIHCQAYLYNRAINDIRLIELGDYEQHCR